jgi:hypothetical protein
LGHLNAQLRARRQRTARLNSAAAP